MPPKPNVTPKKVAHWDGSLDKGHILAEVVYDSPTGKEYEGWHSDVIANPADIEPVTPAPVAEPDISSDNEYKGADVLKAKKK